MEWRVFFIGPMSQPYGDHLEKLRRYFTDRLISRHRYQIAENSELGGVVLVKEDDRITAIVPEEQGLSADIPTNVFHEIDNADLLIADLSGDRTAVVYELAMAHALGVDTILVGEPKTPSFYFSQIRFSPLDFNADPLESRTLGHDIDLWLKTRLKQRGGNNPFHNFYGAPLLDVSAASGLAAGYYENFAGPVLVHGEIVERSTVPRWFGLRRSPREEVRPLKGLVVLRPESLNASIRETETELTRILEQALPGLTARGNADQLFIALGRSPALARGSRGKSATGNVRTPFFVVKDYAIDIPRTIYSLKLSRRLKRMVPLKISRNLDLNMQHVLIECFFSQLKMLVEDDSHIRERGTKLYDGTKGDLPEILRVLE